MKLSTNFMLICALLATHVVPFGHTHEVGKAPVDHSVRPHVHLHGHEHKHGHAHHDHAQGHEQPVRAISCGVIPADHDGDAIYIEMLSSVSATAEGRADVLSAAECVALAAAWTASAALSPPEPVAEPPPRIRLDGPPLYLRNLSLRI